MSRPITPASIHPPFGHYAHGMEYPSGSKLVITSGQLGISKDGAIPSSLEGQATVCFDNIRAILTEAELGPEHIVHLRTYVTDRAFFSPYMAIRDAFLNNRPVSSTLLIVGGFTREEFMIEIEAFAAKSD